MFEKKEVIWLIWKNDEGETFKVGELCRRTGKYYFKYNVDEVKKSKEYGFEILPSLPKEDAEYFRESLFRAFSNRVPDETNKEINEILKTYDIEEYDEFELLKKTGGKLETDTFEFVDPELFENL